MMNPAEKLEGIFCDLMRDEAIPPRQRSKANCAHWDSLMQLGLISSIEQEFSVVLSDQDAIDINSFESALQIIEEKLSEKKG